MSEPLPQRSVLARPFTVLGEAPGLMEDRRGEPFVGWAGSFLRRKLRHIGVLDRAVFMNTVCCFPKQQPDGKPNKDHLNACRPNLKAQLEQVESPWVLAVGAYALRAMVRHCQAITPALGHIIPIHGRFVFPVLHPSFILRVNDPGLEEAWMQELERFVGLTEFGEEVIEFKETCWYCGKLNYPGSPVCYKHRNDWRNDQRWEPVGAKKRKVHPDQGQLL
jgi:uracil-DNA glycosylase family 4